VELGDFELYIQKSMADWHVPGLAIAVVKDDKLVWARGFGQRSLDEAGKVDIDTLFSIGSNTKAFTAAALGTLVDAGKLSWDAPVTGYLPRLQFYDPYVTRELTPRDLLSHRSGICGEDGVWYVTDFSAEEITARLRFQKPAYGLRSQFCYSNSLYMAAGELVPAVTGVPWGEYVRQSFFVPLHMDSSNTSITAFTRQSDLAVPHATVDGRISPIRWHNVDNIAPAGAINSSVRDMSQWLRMLLAGGSFEGRQVLSPGVLREMETPQMLIGGSDGEAKFLSALNPDSRFYAYGLGFFMQDYAGTKVLWHSGHIDGMSAGLGLVPSEHLGVVVLSNMDQSWLPMALVWRVVDGYLHRPPRDWSSDILAVVKPAADADKSEEAKMQKAYQPGPAPLPLADYTGTYSSDLYGSITVSLEGGALVLHASQSFTGDLRHWDHDTFQVQWRYAYLGKSYATFDLDLSGRPVSVSLPGFTTYTRVETQHVTGE
jgi:CubicO group peptidase (beta-lactamase class C family)